MGFEPTKPKQQILSLPPLTARERWHKQQLTCTCGVGKKVLVTWEDPVFIQTTFSLFSLDQYTSHEVLIYPSSRLYLVETPKVQVRRLFRLFSVAFEIPSLIYTPFIKYLYSSEVFIFKEEKKSLITVSDVIGSRSFSVDNALKELHMLTKT